MERKGQAAMEFLMTYGWAILAAIIAIGVLAYFGVFSPGRYIATQCVINAPFGCEEYAIGAPNITLVIRNGGGENLNITYLNLTDGCLDLGYVGIVNDGAKTLALQINCGLSSGDKVKKDVVITYRKIGGIIDLKTTGTVSGRVP